MHVDLLEDRRDRGKEWGEARLLAFLDRADAMDVEALLEHLRWPSGRRPCVHCGFRRSYRMANAEAARLRFKCARCRKQFTARQGTLLERSNLSTARWLRAMSLYLTAPRGGLAARVRRETAMSYKSAWSVVDRLRDAPEDPILVQVRAILESDPPEGVGALLERSGRD
ncbi:MAG: transposase [Rhodospirillum sp.]|nr:transposase [Rhodospirillum sp.]MCF8491736.1 transposase [Rhodospirillum sp.]MCF8499443.1 transposase [Rhodospirillum sp.]